MSGTERDTVEEAEAESFPASDPPAWTLGRTARSNDGPREVVGVFPTTTAFQAAIDALQSSGIDRARLSILAGGSDAEHTLREAGFRSVHDLLDSADAPRIALVDGESVATAKGALVGGLFYVGAAVGGAAAFASGAIALAPILAAVAGSGAAGGTLGGFLAHWLGSGRAAYAEAHLAHGGLVLWVRVTTPDEERRVAALLREHGGHEVHAHGAPDPINQAHPGETR